MPIKHFFSLRYQEPFVEQFPATNPSCAYCEKEWDGSLLKYGGKPLLHEWGVEIEEKLPSCIGDFVQRVISCNSPEKNGG
jgi:hypothetical protein